MSTTSSFLNASQTQPSDLAFHSQVEIPIPFSFKPYGYTKLSPSMLLSFIDFLVTAPLIPPSQWLSTWLTVVLLALSPAIIQRLPHPHGWPILHHGLQFLNLLISSVLPIQPQSDTIPYQHLGLVITKIVPLGESVDLSVVSDSFWPHGFSVHWIIQARIPEWVTIPFSRGSFGPRDQTQVTHIAGTFFTAEPPGTLVNKPSPLTLSLQLSIFSTL